MIKRKFVADIFITLSTLFHTDDMLHYVVDILQC